MEDVSRERLPLRESQMTVPETPSPDVLTKKDARRQDAGFAGASVCCVLAMLHGLQAEPPNPMPLKLHSVGACVRQGRAVAMSTPTAPDAVAWPSRRGWAGQPARH